MAVPADIAPPEVGSIWQHPAGNRKVVEYDAERQRVRWSRPNKTPRWVKLATWHRWVRDAQRVPEWPKRPKPLKGVRDAFELVDLGSQHPRLHGVLAPAPPQKLLKAQRPEWLRVVSECLARGVDLQEIAGATGLTLRVVASLRASIRARYKEITPGQLQLRQETLYWDARRVFDFALRRAEALPDDTDPRAVAALLKEALSANKRMAALTGADRKPEMGLVVENVNVVNVVNPVQVAAQRFGLDADALATMGDAAAGALTTTARKQLEVEYAGS